MRCSGNPGDGPCANCSRLDLSCSFADADAEEPAFCLTASSQQRKNSHQKPHRAASRHAARTTVLTAHAVSRTTPSQSHTEAGTLRKRARRACRQCHAHKTKCSGDLPRCKRCEAGGIACEYAPTKRRFANAPVGHGMDLTIQSSGAIEENVSSRSSPSPPCRSGTNTSPTPSVASTSDIRFHLVVDGPNLTAE